MKCQPSTQTAKVQTKTPLLAWKVHQFLHNFGSVVFLGSKRSASKVRSLSVNIITRSSRKEHCISHSDSIYPAVNEQSMMKLFLRGWISEDLFILSKMIILSQDWCFESIQHWLKSGISKHLTKTLSLTKFPNIILHFELTVNFSLVRDIILLQLPALSQSIV